MDKMKLILEKINIHVVFAVVFVGIIAIIGIRLYIWDNNAKILDFGNGDGTDIGAETLDNLVAYTYEAEPKDPEDMVIACFGNAPFSDSYGEDDNLAALIAERTGSKVYNFSFADSFLSCEQSVLTYSTKDLFSLYWLTTIFAIDNDQIVDGYLKANPDTPVQTKATLSLLQNLDFNNVDVIAIMYDSSDYLAERGMYNRDDSQNIRHFGGALEASIKLIKEYLPHIQIIVMSPTYAYGLEDDGTLVDSTLKRYGDEGPLADYVQYQADVCTQSIVTFLDNFYGTVTYYNADQYLTDHKHLTKEGRELVADKFMEGYNYYLRFRNKTNE